MLLLCGSIVKLQTMPDMSNEFGIERGFKFNSLKSSCVSLGENANLFSLPPMFIGGNVISWSEKLIYLNTDICSGKRFLYS